MGGTNARWAFVIGGRDAGDRGDGDSGGGPGVSASVRGVVRGFRYELQVFPGGRHDDWVDSVVPYLEWVEVEGSGGALGLRLEGGDCRGLGQTWVCSQDREQVGFRFLAE